MNNDFRCVVTGEKGGSGKSMIAVELAIIAANSGVPTTLIDGDPQGTASAFLHRRQKLIADDRSEGGAMTELACPRVVKLSGRDLAAVLDEENKKGSRFLIVDLAGRDGALVREAISSVDVAVVPMRPTAADLSTAKGFDDLIGSLAGEAARLKVAYFVINQAPTHALRKAAQLEAAIATLADRDIRHVQLVDMAVSERFHFVKGWLGEADALSVTEMVGADKAAEEIMGVYDRLTAVATTTKAEEGRGTA